MRSAPLPPPSDDGETQRKKQLRVHADEVEAACEVLRRAAEGRLSSTELKKRLGSVRAAGRQGRLAFAVTMHRVLSDLPAEWPPAPPASDAERKTAIDRLVAASSAGHLGVDELDERLGKVNEAQTKKEIDEILADLPAFSIPASKNTDAVRKSVAKALVVQATESRSAAFLGRLSRCGGGWNLAGYVTLTHTVSAVLAKVDVDVSHPDIGGDTIELYVRAVLGAVTVMIPEDAELVVEGRGTAGVFDNNAVHGNPTNLTHRARRFIVEGRALLGTVRIVRSS